MKRIVLFVVLALVGLTFAGSTVADAQKKMKKEPILWPAADIKWVDPPSKDAPPGVMVSSLWGDMSKGAYGALVKFTQVMDTPLHTHSFDVKGVVISGSFWVAPEGGEKTSFGPGSYMMIPGGWKHTSGNEAGTVLFQEGPGKFDLKPVETKTDETMKK